MVQYRCYGAGGPSVSASELQDQVLNVLKMFDKINPDKVTIAVSMHAIPAATLAKSS